MAVANVAVLLGNWGARVLVVDWDLEAPGIEKYFQPYRLSATRKEKPGILDLIMAHKNKIELPWRKCIIKATPIKQAASVDIITAGQDTPEYTSKLQQIDWGDLFKNHQLGPYLNNLRQQWTEEYDYVLVDSRTGINDIGGICTIILPDILVLLFTTNDQSVKGVADVMRRARRGQDNLPDERGRLIAVPVLSRDESRTEYKQARHWRERIAGILDEFYRDWIWKDLTPREVLQKLYLPYWPYWSFGERLPVVEAKDELDDPRTLGAAYSRLALLLGNQLDWKALDRAADPHELAQQRAEKAEAAKRADTAEKKAAKYLIILTAIIGVISFAVGFLWIESIISKRQPDQTELAKSLYLIEKPLTERVAILRQLAASGYRKFDNLNLSGIEIEKLTLPLASMRSANLSKSKLRNVDLQQADLRSANLRDAHFVEVNLQGANLQNAILKDIQFENVDLRGANLKGAQVSQENLKGLLMDAKTTLPNGKPYKKTDSNPDKSEK